MKKTFLVLATLIAMPFAAFATSTDGITGNDSIWLGGSVRSTNWRAVGRDELIIWSSPKKPYLVKIWRPFRSLKFVNAIGYRTTTNRLTKFDSIYVDGQRLPIKSIVALDPGMAQDMRYHDEEGG